MQSISVKVNFVYKEIRKPVELVNHWYSLAESVRPLFDDAFNFRNTASDIFRYSYISFQKVHGGVILLDWEWNPKESMAGRQNMFRITGL